MSVAVAVVVGMGMGVMMVCWGGADAGVLFELLDTSDVHRARVSAGCLLACVWEELDDGF
jgi:hypothetical protein